MKCRKCGGCAGYNNYYCKKCIKEVAGEKPIKSKKLCKDCRQDWYNQNKDGGCWHYKDGKLKIKPVCTRRTQVIPYPQWRLTCFVFQY